MSLAKAFIAETRRVRLLQVTALWLGAAVVLFLILLLFGVVRSGFEGHLAHAEGLLVKMAERAPAIADAEALAQKRVNENSAETSKGNRAPHKPSAAASDVLAMRAEIASERKSLHELVATGLKSLAYSSVAVISILVVAITILTLGIAKVIFAMAPHRMSDDSKSPTATKPAADDATFALPHLEFAKEFTKLFADFFRKAKGE